MIDIIDSLNMIRQTIDADIIDSDIEVQKNKMLKLTQLIGLSSECKSEAKKALLKKELEVLKELEGAKISPSILTKRLDAECWNEAGVLMYADRINASITHSIDAIRTTISLYKTEIENSLKQ
jgi:hypothetical protein